MDIFGRFRRGSSVMTAHYAMLASLIFSAGVFCFYGWTGLLATSGLFILIVVLGTYPFAYRSAYKSLWRERVSGTLEQLYLTSLNHEQLFEGKFFGSIAPFFEVKNYFVIHCLIFCFSVAFVFGGPLWLAALCLCMISLNHFGYSACLGTLGGLKAGCAGQKMSRSMIELKYNPWVVHSYQVLRIALFLALPLGILYKMSKSHFGSNVMYAAYGLLMVIPIYTVGILRQDEGLKRENLKKDFRNVFDFESN